MSNQLTTQELADTVRLPLLRPVKASPEVLTALANLAVLQARAEQADRLRDALIAYCDSCDANGGLPSTVTLRALAASEETQ